MASVVAMACFGTAHRGADAPDQNEQKEINGQNDGRIKRSTQICFDIPSVLDTRGVCSHKTGKIWSCHYNAPFSYDAQTK